MSVFGAIALSDLASMRVADLRTVVLPQIVSALEIACAKDVKRRLNVPFDDTPEALTRFFTLVSSLAVEKKVILLVSAVGTEAQVDRFQQVASQFLARVVTRVADLKLVAGQGGSSKKIAPLSPLSRWVTAAAGLIFLVLVESIMAFYQKPATMDEATKLSLANAQASLRRDISEDDLAVNATLIIMRRYADHKLIYPTLPADVCNQVFAVDLLAHLPMSLKPKLVAFDDAARMSVPATESFEVRMAAVANQPLCTALLGSWAEALKSEKVAMKKAVQQHVAALAAVPPPPPSGQRPAARPAQGQRGSANHCFTCERAGRAPAHPRETCEHYKCFGCGLKAPGHLYRNCPDPRVGGPCPPHIN